MSAQYFRQTCPVHRPGLLGSALKGCVGGGVGFNCIMWSHQLRIGLKLGCDKNVTNDLNIQFVKRSMAFLGRITISCSFFRSKIIQLEYAGEHLSLWLEKISKKCKAVPQTIQKVSLLSLHFNPHLIPYISVSSIPTIYQNMLGDRDIRNLDQECNTMHQRTCHLIASSDWQS